jgi:hypothetical protein
MFDVNPQELQRIQNEISNHIDPVRLYYTSIDQLQDQNVNPAIRCGICSGLAYFPVQC